MDEIFIQRRFRIERDGYSYSDAVVLPQSEFEKLTEGDIEAIKEERFTNWLNIIQNPPIPVEPSKEDLEAQVVSIDEQIASLQAQKVEVAKAVLTAKPKPVEEKPIEEEQIVNVVEEL